MENNTNVKIISKELIKPSSPTPDHLKTLKLSLIDQVASPFYISLIFFYEADELKDLTQSTDDQTRICHLLKQSLSNTLSIYYPLAGKIDPVNFRIDCDDNGVEFVVARAQGGRLGDVIENPNLKSLEKYLPVDPLGGIYKGEGTLFMAQVNFFECGGVAIGACVSHIVADADALIKFVKVWADEYRVQNPKPSPPKFGAMANYLPARDLSDSSISPSLLFGGENVVTKRFMFDREKLAALKQKVIDYKPSATNDYDYVKDPTRVELITAFIWKHLLENNILDAKKSCVAHIVDLRSRVSLFPKTEHVLGNEHFLVAAWTPRVLELHELVGQLRKAIRGIDDEYIREARDQDRYTKDLGELCDAVLEGGEGFLFTSWARFPIYEVDFGWGRPAWVGTAALPFNNFAIFMNTKFGDIEVWINLLSEKVEAFENQFNLISDAKLKAIAYGY